MRASGLIHAGLVIAGVCGAMAACSAATSGDDMVPVASNAAPNNNFDPNNNGGIVANDAGAPRFSDACALSDGGVPTAPGDQCPGTLVELDFGEPAADAGSGLTLSEIVTAPMQGMVSDTYGYCSREQKPDVFYRLHARRAGTLSVRPMGGEVTDALILQGTCGMAASVLGCGTPPLEEPLRLALEADQEVTLVVDSWANEASFEMNFAPPACGDSVVHAGETCDFGDSDAGDGCSATCQWEPPGDDSDVCAGEALGQVKLGELMAVPGYTAGYTDNYAAPCGAKSGAPDRVFNFNAGASGLLRAKLDADFDGVLSIYQRCQIEQLQGLLACSDHELALRDEALLVSVVQGAQYFVVIDGYSKDNVGRFELSLELSTQ